MLESFFSVLALGGSVLVFGWALAHLFPDRRSKSGGWTRRLTLRKGKLTLLALLVMAIGLLQVAALMGGLVAWVQQNPRTLLGFTLAVLAAWAGVSVWCKLAKALEAHPPSGTHAQKDQSVSMVAHRVTEHNTLLP